MHYQTKTIEQTLLVNPFLTQIYSFKVSSQGFKTRIFGQEIIFRLILSPMLIEIIFFFKVSKFIESIQKKKYLYSLNQEVYY
jgi:hypothetical protein